jgi:hypothetical protein
VRTKSSRHPEACEQKVVVILRRPKEAEGSQPITAIKQPLVASSTTIVILSEAKDLSSKRKLKKAKRRRTKR